MLKRRGVPHEVLNAKQHEREAMIIAEAGRKGAVTVATNMAGRGTDITLGGNPDHIADKELHAKGLSPLETPEEYEQAWPEAIEKAKQAVKEEHEEVTEARRPVRPGAPSGTSRGASTTSCAAVPAVRATRASRGSTSRSKTT